MSPPIHAPSSRTHVAGVDNGTAAGRGFKGFFSRSNRVASPEPVEPSTRSRLRSFISEAAKVGSSSKAPTQGRHFDAPKTSSSSKDAATKRSKQQTLSGEVTAGRRRIIGETARDMKPRPSTPTDRTQRHIRLDPTALPVLQKGVNGKWQPPSLSRGSMSTSALASLAKDDEEDRTARPMPGPSDMITTSPSAPRLSNMFKAQMTGSPRSADPFALDLPGRGTRDQTIRASKDQEGGKTKRHRISSPSSPSAHPPPSCSSPTQSSTIKASPVLHQETTVRASSRRSSMDTSANTQLLASPTITHIPDRAPHPPPPSSSSRARVATSSPPPSASSKSHAMAPPPIPTHSRHDSAPTSLLSREHYLIRLSASFLVKVLTPVFRSSMFVQSEKNAEMKRLAEERLLALARMEKAWEADWMKVAGTLTHQDQDTTRLENPAVGSMEAKVRLTYVGERAKERERKAWSDAIKDGILLCFLLNHLFPASPSHITRVNVTEEGIARFTNVARFMAACQTVGLPDGDVFCLPDMQGSSEGSLGKVAHTIVALARLAGPSSAAVGRSKSPGGSTPNSRPASRAAAAPLPLPLPLPSRPPVSLTRPSPQPSPARRASVDGTVSSSIMNRRRSAEGANDLLVKLQVATDRQQAVGVDLNDPSAYKTPTTSTFSLPAVPPELPSAKRQSLTRASTQPSISPSLRPKSPDSSPSSRSTTPVGRVPSLQIRPTLRPRNTTGSKTSVSFVDDQPNSHQANTAAAGQFTSHSRERTPSLISSGSRLTSSVYSRSSAALSIATVTGDDHGTVVDVVEEDETGDAAVTRLRERRMSEKTLQNARQKILGTLLSSEDLPRDLRQAVQDSRTTPKVEDEERDTAISKSLAALEGTRTSPRPNRTDTSPRARPIPRRGQSTETDRPQHVSRVLEEDEQGQSTWSMLSSDGSRPSAIRRISANGKFYVPKRSVSPASGFSSPTGIAFPLSSSLPNAAGVIRDRSPDASDSPTMTDHLVRPERAERRQSDGCPIYKDRQERQDCTFSSETSARPMQMRINSMVNLPTSDSDPPSMFRVSSASSVIKSAPSPSLQTLEFREAGCPVVKYQLGNCIGRGQFGSVYRSLNLSTGQMVAIKRIRLHGMREDEVCDVMREVELLKRLSHPSIVKYEGMSRDDEYLNIVLEFVENGSLGQTLKAFGQFNETLVSSYVAKILEGLDYLHSQGVVHCDLKAANILSTKNGNVKLSDFGVSLNLKAVENIKHDAETAGKGGVAKKRVSEVAGTPNWMAPEVISLAGASFASDIWSLGCTIIELLTGKPPYAEITNSMTVLFRIVEDESPPFPPNISDALRDFLKLCFIKDPKARPTAALLFEHPWVKAYTPELALRPQDSVPFLRRVSMQIRRVDSQRMFEGTSAENVNEDRRNPHSMASSHGREGSDGFRKHHIIKTSFGTSVACRVCLTNVKKAGVLCQDCGLIAHTTCASKASPRCDIQEQLALYARQQELLQLQLARPISSPSKGPSPMPSFEREGALALALPGKILNGFKRSRSKSAMSPPPQTAHHGFQGHAELRRRHTDNHNHNQNQSQHQTQDRHSNQNQNQNQKQSQTHGRPSLDTNPSSRSASFSMNQNRSSLYSQISEYTQDLGHQDASAKRRSAIRFELNVVDAPEPVSVPMAVGVTSSKGKGGERARVGVMPAEGRQNIKGEGKTDCCIQ